MDGGITIKIEGGDHLMQVLSRITAPERRRDLLSSIGQEGVSLTQDRFQNQAGPDGTPWLQSLRAKLVSGQTLIKSNRLASSFTFAATDQAVEWGTNVIYAGIHQFGGIIKPKSKKALKFKGADGRIHTVKQVTIPARPFLGVTESDQKEFVEVFNDWLKGAMI